MIRIRKLTLEQRAEMRALKASGVFKANLACIFNCSVATVDYHTVERVREQRRAYSRAQNQRAA